MRANSEWSQEELNAKIHMALGSVPMSVSEAVWELVSRAIPADRRRVVESQDPLGPMFKIPFSWLMNPQVMNMVVGFYMDPKDKRTLVICGGDMKNPFGPGSLTIEAMKMFLSQTFGATLNTKKITLSLDKYDEVDKMRIDPVKISTMLPRRSKGV